MFIAREAADYFEVVKQLGNPVILCSVRVMFFNALRDRHMHLRRHFVLCMWTCIPAHAHASCAPLQVVSEGAEKAVAYSVVLDEDLRRRDAVPSEQVALSWIFYR